jgi:hypothetical protein
MTKTNITLALYPNHRGFGFAFFENPKTPLDCGLVTIRPISNEDCMKRIRNIIEYYKPTLIIVQDTKETYPRKSPRVKKLIQHIERYATSQHLTVTSYGRDQIRFVFEQFKAVTKYEIAKTIVRWLPQFAHKLPKVRKVWMCEDYNMGTFDAMSLAITHFYLS